MSTLATIRTTSARLASATGLGARVKTTPVGLVIDDALDFEEWNELGDQILAIVDATQWWVGDWVTFGLFTFGEEQADKYTQAMARTGYAYGTLRNIASVCERFHLSRRRDNSEHLTFSHFVEVAMLDMADQERWLTRAETMRLSHKALRAQIAAERGLPSPQLQVPEADALRSLASLLKEPSWRPRAQQWTAAASASGLEFGDWAADALDKAAA